MSPWQVLESLGEAVVIVDDRFRVVWIKEPLLALAKPGVNPLGHYCYSVLFDRSAKEFIQQWVFSSRGPG